MSRKLDDYMINKISTMVKAQFPVEDMDFKDIVKCVLWEYQKHCKLDEEVYR